MKNKIIISLFLLLVSSSFYSCRKKGCTDSNASNYDEDATKDDGTCSYKPVYGKYYAGGIVFYINSTSDKCLVAAPNDQSAGCVWGCNGTVITGADGQAVFTGRANTLDIINGCFEANIAARYCFDLSLNGWSDWHLPSQTELGIMYNARAVIGGFTIGNTYWSSSEVDGANARGEVFFEPSPGYSTPVTLPKTSIARVRAIKEVGF